MFVIFVIFVGFHQNSQRGSRGGLLECNDRSINGRWMAAHHQMCEHCTALCRFLQIWVALLYKHCLPICSSGSMSTICSWFDPNRASVLKDNVRKGMISKYLNTRIVIYNDIHILGLKPPTKYHDNVQDAGIGRPTNILHYFNHFPGGEWGAAICTSAMPEALIKELRTHDL